jgi:hypothetical protein
VSSGVITINDTTSAAGTVTAVTLTVGWSDESGRPGSVSSAANVSQPPPSAMRVRCVRFVAQPSQRVIAPINPEQSQRMVTVTTVLRLFERVLFH